MKISHSATPRKKSTRRSRLAEISFIRPLTRSSIRILARLSGIYRLAAMRSRSIAAGLCGWRWSSSACRRIDSGTFGSRRMVPATLGARPRKLTQARVSVSAV